MVISKEPESQPRRPRNDRHSFSPLVKNAWNKMTHSTIVVGNIECVKQALGFPPSLDAWNNFNSKNCGFHLSLRCCHWSRTAWEIKLSLLLATKRQSLDDSSCRRPYIDPSVGVILLVWCRQHALPSCHSTPSSKLTGCTWWCRSYIKQNKSMQSLSMISYRT
jgi:hypothetical protein